MKCPSCASELCFKEGATPGPQNRLCLDYEGEAERLGAPPAPITDIHTHVNGQRASRVYRRVCDAFGIERVFSMTFLSDVDVVREALAERVHFIAVPDFRAKDRVRAFQEGFLESIERFHAEGSRIVKFWAAPRAKDFGREVGDADLLALDGAWRVRAMELAQSLGMMFMTHVADPDTWFSTKYADASVYGTKGDQYLALERMLDRFPAPWIAAHMGGWPEDLAFLDGLLERHDNLHLDTSATKWMVRELSAHPREVFVDFFEKWEGRVFFGSDIVTTDEHFKSDHTERGMGHLASSEDQAFELYASRVWALRVMFETGYEGESPIADPDLAMVDPVRFDAMSAPALRGRALSPRLLRSIYRDASERVVGAWIKAHP